MHPPVSRAPLIDTLKGLACIAIVWHHLAFYGPMSDVALPLAPNLIAWLYDHARLAVQVQYRILRSNQRRADSFVQGAPA